MDRFIFDPAKDQANRNRHGIGFLEAQSLWKRPHLIVPARRVIGEPRWALIGGLRGKCTVAIFTIRGNLIRIISCHRADRRWERIYETFVHQK